MRGHTPTAWGVLMRKSSAVTEQRVMELAPPHPPCFEDQREWRQYLLWCVRSVEIKPIKVASSGAASFNHELEFCADCCKAHRVEMELQERCRPSWLRDMAAAKEAA